MAQENKLCPICNTVGHSKFYCKERPKKPIARTALERKKPLKALRAVSTHGSTVPSIIAKKKPAKKKAPTRSQLVKKLDKVFSIYIRLRAADESGNVTCVTSGIRGHWKTMQAGHFYTRGRYPTRWDETNVHVQSVQSNIFLKGDYINYTRFMIDKYGREYVDELERKSLSTVKISTPQLKEMIAEYEAKTKLLIGG